MVSKNSTQIQKEFNDFAEKIAKLESLKHELEILDTKGFETDVKLIRAKLKDVSAIPSIRRDINSLREKIEKKKTATVFPTNSLKKRISHIESLIEHKKILACKKPLSHEEIKSVQEIPKLEKELKKLKDSFDEHFGNLKKVKIDSGIGILVDTKFDDFIASLKNELSKKLRVEEQGLKQQEELHLKSDLDKRKELFMQKFSELEAKKLQEYHDMYKKKVEQDLQKEIKTKFNEELNKKITAIKDKTISKTKNDLLKGLMQKDAQKLNYKVKKLDNMTKKVIQSTKKKMHEEMISTVKAKMREEEKHLRSKLEREYKEKLNRDTRLKQAELAKKKAQLEKFVSLQAKRLFK